MPRPLLRLTEISKAFAAVQALRQVSFDLLAGEVHALVGENGAGKSTLIQVISGALGPDEGSIEVMDRQFNHLVPAQARQLGITCIYQHPALFPDLTVAENIALRLEPFVLGKVDWPARRRRAQHLLSRIGTDVPAGAVVRDLSMPEQQLVEIACALGADARIVIMDEPTASLTRREQQLLYSLVDELRRADVGIIYVSHRLEEIFALADRVTVLRDGRQVSTSAARDLSESSLIRLMVGRELSAVAQRRSRTDVRQGQQRIGAETTSRPHVQPACEAAPPVLEARNIGCACSGLSNISFELRAGEILGLAGLVGAGRTELGLMLFGITPADSGQIILDGKPVRLDSARAAVARGIAYVPEDRTRHGVILDLPVAQNITMAIHQRVFPKNWLRLNAERELATEQIRALAITPVDPDAPVSCFSGGNQQKVSVGRWLATQPRILILDEPTQGVDIGAKNEIHGLIQVLADKGMAVLLISSDLPELLALSDRIGVMRGGRLVSILPGQSPAQEIMALAFGQSVQAS